MAARKPKSLGGTIVKAITLDAPVERVYRAFTQRSDLEQWLAEPYDVDARAGGSVIGRAVELRHHFNQCAGP